MVLLSRSFYYSNTYNSLPGQTDLEKLEIYRSSVYFKKVAEVQMTLETFSFIILKV